MAGGTSGPALMEHPPQAAGPAPVLWVEDGFSTDFVVRNCGIPSLACLSWTLGGGSLISFFLKLKDGMKERWSERKGR